MMLGSQPVAICVDVVELFVGFSFKILGAFGSVISTSPLWGAPELPGVPLTSPPEGEDCLATHTGGMDSRPTPPPLEFNVLAFLQIVES